ncbi:MAG TPA: hypothetical protein VG122_18180 [Gemmata sp.]|jgi:hypothetical protein|nr:hypothetical protein [Gemmata sp.]
MNDSFRDPTADFVMSRFETNLRLIESGIIDVPRAEADMAYTSFLAVDSKELPS